MLGQGIDEIHRREWARVVASLARDLPRSRRGRGRGGRGVRGGGPSAGRGGHARNPGAWLLTVARNAALDRVRRESDPRGPPGSGARAADGARGAQRAALGRAAGRRPAAAGLHLLPPGPAGRGAGRADAAAGRGASRRSRSPGPSSCPRRRWPSGWSGPSGGSRRQGALPRPGGRRAPRAARRRAARRLPGVPRGLHAQRGRRPAARRPVRRGDPRRAASCRAPAGRGRGRSACWASCCCTTAGAPRASTPRASSCCWPTRTAAAGTTA